MTNTLKNMAIVSLFVFAAACAKPGSDSSPGGNGGGGGGNGGGVGEKPDGTEKITDTQLSGQLYGKPFTIGKATARRTMIKGVQVLFIYMAPKGKKFGCLTEYPTDYVAAQTPAKPGGYTGEKILNPDGSTSREAEVWFAASGAPVGKSPISALDYSIRIESITGNEVRGGLYGKHINGEIQNDVNGVFTAEICD